MKVLVYLLISLTPCFLLGQPSIEWEKSLGGSSDDAAYSIIQTSDGGYITVGKGNSPDGHVSQTYGIGDIWVVKLDMFGVIEWERSYGGGSENAFTIIEIDSGGYLIGGRGGSSMPTWYGLWDVWLIKISATGDVIWHRNYGGSSDDYVEDIAQNANGNFVIVGSTKSNDNDLDGYNVQWEDLWVFEIDPSGNILWQKTIGGSSVDLGRSIEPNTWDGGYIVAGATYSYDGDVSQNYGGGDCWVVKLDSLGNILWEKNYGGSDAEMANSIIPTFDGGFLFTSFTRSADMDVSNNNGGSADMWTVKLDNAGNIDWEVSSGSSGNDYGREVIQTAQGDYVIAGWSDSPEYTNDSLDYWLVKLNATGDLWWEKNLGGSDHDRCYDISKTNDGGIIVCGSSHSSDLDVTNAMGNEDMWIVKLSSELSLNEVKSVTSLPVVKILDVMGREAKYKPNTLLVYIYSDGTTERVFKVE